MVFKHSCPLVGTETVEEVVCRCSLRVQLTGTGVAYKFLLTQYPVVGSLVRKLPSSLSLGEQLKSLARDHDLCH